tara:strand:- start:641 stop:1054 length:414 start_codon:yes stop_codon:yes gene_type:complete
LSLLGLAQYPVALFDMASLARCVATLGGLLSQGVCDQSIDAFGNSSPGNCDGKLVERVCWLQPGEDWRCFKELIKAVELAVKDQREVLVKCHPEMVAMKVMQYKLDEYAHTPPRESGQLKARVGADPRTQDLKHSAS